MSVSEKIHPGSSGDSGPAEAGPRRWDHPRWWWLVALACLGALYITALGGRQIQPGFGDGPSVYIVSALSLAHGAGYRLINYPDAPPALLYPIGYPLLLSIVFRIFEFGATGIFICRLLNVVAAVLWVEAGRRLLKRAMNPLLAACAALAMGLTPLLVEMNGQVKADVIFGAVAMWAMVAATSEGESSGDRRGLPRSIGVGILAAGSMLIRTIGFTFVFGLGAEMILKRRWPRLVGFAIGAGVVLGPWMLGRLSHHGSTFQSYASENDITWRTPLSHFWLLTTDTAPAMTFPLLGTPAWSRIAQRTHLDVAVFALGFAIMLIVVLGWISLLRRMHPISLVLGPYMAVVFLWWFEPTRFIIPVLPLMLYCAAEGAKIIFRGRSTPIGRVTIAALLLCICGGMAVDAVHVHRAWKRGDIEAARGDANWKQMQQGLAWLNANTPHDAVVFTSYPAAVYLFTSRNTLDLNNGSHNSAVYVPIGEMDLDEQFRKGDNFPSAFVFATYRWDYLKKMEWGIGPVKRYIDKHPGRLQPLWSSGDGSVLIYKVNRS